MTPAQDPAPPETEHVIRVLNVPIKAAQARVHALMDSVCVAHL
jgi:hypothetical protein